ncbi:hypothetical protein MGYG_09084 [Nannizzia gypsea CBS 118893]|uniref:Uncharacterized protein n=1 Tax=Arthroderma gypseum (strain ATCC MYA-4604 / CBS 118893) TaxID=535722 RepID=E4UVU2_ARTGP|nr:hypothetical protein MGYG_09084 [Nannizzia gypsea CBS 118893]EFR02419.1 hypothetical protein MGYG_09084 [Nannizzia gypsea CBS 118893]
MGSAAIAAPPADNAPVVLAESLEKRGFGCSLGQDCMPPSPKFTSCSLILHSASILAASSAIAVLN